PPLPSSACPAAGCFHPKHSGPDGAGAPAPSWFRPMSRLTSPALAAVVLACIAAPSLPACDSSPDDVREWTANDHDQPAGLSGQVPARSANPDASGNAAAPELIELAWARNCAVCHGRQGRGDGPQGPMMRSPDLTRADWQARVTDEQVAEVIR